MCAKSYYFWMLMSTPVKECKALDGDLTSVLFCWLRSTLWKSVNVHEISEVVACIMNRRLLLEPHFSHKNQCAHETCKFNWLKDAIPGVIKIFGVSGKKRYRSAIARIVQAQNLNFEESTIRLIMVPCLNGVVLRALEHTTVLWDEIGVFLYGISSLNTLASSQSLLA